MSLCFKGDKESAIHHISVENPRIRLSDDRFNTRYIERYRGMLSGGAAPKILPCNDHIVLRIVSPLFHKTDISLRESGLCLRHTGEGISPVHLPLLRIAQTVDQVLSRDDLIRVNIVAKDVGFAFDNLFHSKIPL